MATEIVKMLSVQQSNLEMAKQHLLYLRVQYPLYPTEHWTLNSNVICAVNKNPNPAYTIKTPGCYQRPFNTCCLRFDKAMGNWVSNQSGKTCFPYLKFESGCGKVLAIFVHTLCRKNCTQNPSPKSFFCATKGTCTPLKLCAISADTVIHA